MLQEQFKWHYSDMEITWVLLFCLGGHMNMYTPLSLGSAACALCERNSSVGMSKR